MATKVFMEALSPTMEEGRLSTWLKNEGDTVKEGDVLAEVETDKATMELVARGSGVLRSQLIKAGDTSPVGNLIAVIAGADEDISALVSGAAAPAPAAEKQDATPPASDEAAQPEQPAQPEKVSEAPAPAAPPETARKAPPTPGLQCRRHTATQSHAKIPSADSAPISRRTAADRESNPCHLCNLWQKPSLGPP